MAVFPRNRDSIVNSIIERVPNLNPDKVVQVQQKITEFLSDGSRKETWVPHERLPNVSLRTALLRYLDITTPPTQQFLSLMAAYCEDVGERQAMENLAAVSNKAHPCSCLINANPMEYLLSDCSILCRTLKDTKPGESQVTLTCKKSWTNSLPASHQPNSFSLNSPSSNLASTRLVPRWRSIRIPST